jgi:hypothetical protein
MNTSKANWIRIPSTNWKKHLGDCPSCLQYVKSYRQIIELTHKHCLPETPMPPALKQKLREFIEQNPDLK